MSRGRKLPGEEVRRRLHVHLGEVVARHAFCSFADELTADRSISALDRFAAYSGSTVLASDRPVYRGSGRMTRMSDTVIEALDAARAAYERATEALRLAESAARAAGLDVTPLVVDELMVKRINVVEDDGTLRMIIGNSTIGRRLPMRGRVIEHPGRHETAGMLFVNDEGTECGGLTFGGHRRGPGKEQYAALTFDDYEQNEGFRFGMVQEGSVVRRWLEFCYIPDWSLADLVDELERLDAEAARAVQERYDAQGGFASRLRLAREDDGSVRLVLRDARGRDRLRFVVPADGEPQVEMLDVDGVPRSLVPD